MGEKLSPAMQHVIDLMANDWELGHSSGMRASVWLQRGGCGRGGDTRQVHASTFYGLYQRKLIRERKRDCPTTTYQLTALG